MTSEIFITANAISTNGDSALIVKERDPNGTMRKYFVFNCSVCGIEIKRRDNVGTGRCTRCARLRTYAKEPEEYKELPNTFWCYLAGFYDGEGCLSKSWNSPYQLSITQVDRSVLDWIVEQTGFGKVYLHSRQNGNHAESWTLRFTNPFEIRWILSNMSRYLKVKYSHLKLYTEYLAKRLDSDKFARVFL